MCRFARVPLVIIGDLNLATGLYSYVDPPQATGVFTAYCLEHHCCAEISIRPYTVEESWICPMRPDELSKEGKAELQFRRR